MRCDVCGWRISKKEYDGQGECFCCVEGQMTAERDKNQAPCRSKKARILEVVTMLLEKIIRLIEKHGWKQQVCGLTGISGSVGTNFYKDGKVLTVSLIEEGHMIYPDEDELKEMFGETENEQRNEN